MCIASEAEYFEEGKIKIEEDQPFCFLFRFLEKKNLSLYKTTM